MVVGVLPAMVAAIGFAAFQTINRRALSRIDVYRGTASVLGVGAVLLVGLTWVLHGPSSFVQAEAAAYGYFIAAGLLHFFCGWTLLGISQVHLGAARAGVVVGTLPLFGALVAATVLDEALTPLDVVALVLVVGGIALVAPVRRRSRAAPPADSREQPSGRKVVIGMVAGLMTALLWAISPVLIRGGLAFGAEPITGAAIGQAAAAALYGVAIAVTRGRRDPAARRIDSGTRRLLAAAAVAVAISIWMQWTAYHLAPVAVVLSVLQFTPPMVVAIAAVITKEPLGDRARWVWIGSLVTLVGALMLIAE